MGLLLKYYEKNVTGNTAPTITKCKLSFIIFRYCFIIQFRKEAAGSRPATDRGKYTCLQERPEGKPTAQSSLGTQHSAAMVPEMGSFPQQAGTYEKAEPGRESGQGQSFPPYAFLPFMRGSYIKAPGGGQHRFTG